MSPPPVNRSALLDTVGGDPDFLAVLVETFLDDCPRYLEDIRSAVEEEDPETLAQEAHGLKGAASLLHAVPVRQRARRLEQIGEAGTVDEAVPVLDELEEEVGRLAPALRSVVEDVTETA